MIILSLIVLGVIVGSLINLAADDLPRRLTPRFPPHCPTCDSPLHPLRRIAIVGVLTNHIKCLHCESSLKLRSLAVEIVSPFMLLYLYQRFDLTLKFGLLAILMECLLVIAVIDLEHRLILYVTIIPAALIAFIYAMFGAGYDLPKSLIGGAVGFGAVYVIYFFGWVFGVVTARIRGEELNEVPFGGGDVNLAGVIGLAVGWSGILLALFIAVMSGGISAAIYLTVSLIRRRYNLFTPIPYGPFLILGAVILLLFADEIRNRTGASR
ncbi:MAG: prepilin peptidase [Chloroflexi bacterium]|nr:prepilin peptidase [Chloroflexota bacterium]